MTKTNIDAVLAEHAAALARREDARKAFIEADANVQALGEIIREQGGARRPGMNPHSLRTDWLRAAERVSAEYHATLMPVPLPQEIAAAYSRLKAKLSQFLVE